MVTRGPASIARFVVGRGGILSMTTVSLKTLDETRLAGAHQAYSHLHAHELPVSVPWPDGNEGQLGLGVPPSSLASEVISEGIKTLNDDRRKAWEDIDATNRRLRDSMFYLTTSTTTNLYQIVRDSPADDLARARLYGFMLPSTFTRVTLQQAKEPEPGSHTIPQQRADPAVQQMCDEVFAAAPAFVCYGRLDGVAAEFADYFAIAMLRERNSSLR